MKGNKQMIKRIKTLLITMSTAITMLLPGLVPAVVHAQSSSLNTAQTGLCSGANLSLSGGACQNTQSSLDSIIKFVLNLFSIIVGIIAVVMIIIGGLKYTISGGDSTRVSGAKDTILFAIVGIVIVALAQVIVHFVLTNVGTQSGLGTGS